MLSKVKFKVPEHKKVRIIIDTDAACEADDQYAIVHALLTPRFIIKGIVAENFHRYGGENTVEKSYDEIQNICNLMNINTVPTFHGCENPLIHDNETASSDGVDFIIREALADSTLPLFILCQGAITTVAAALNKAPEIADKFTCIWIGGGAYPAGSWEFNLFGDYHAANAVYKSGVELWQIPMNCYTQIQVSQAELQVKVFPQGSIGRYLFDNMQKVKAEGDWDCIEHWVLGDSPAPALAMNPACGKYELCNAPLVNENGEYTDRLKHKIRVYHTIDSRYILEDFYAKLHIFINPTA